MSATPRVPRELHAPRVPRELHGCWTCFELWTNKNIYYTAYTVYSYIFHLVNSIFLNLVKFTAATRVRFPASWQILYIKYVKTPGTVNGTLGSKQKEMKKPKKNPGNFLLQQTWKHWHQRCSWTGLSGEQNKGISWHSLPLRH